MDTARRVASNIEQIPDLSAALVSHHMNLQQARRSKGVIGTAGKPAISIRIDDGQDALKTNIAALLTARGLPFSLVTIYAGQGSQPWWSTATWADLHTWRQKGGEVWSHGFDHRDYYGALGLEACYRREIVTSKAELEAQGFKVQGFALPGITPVSPPLVPFPPDGLGSIAGYHGYVGRTLLQTYALIESGAQGVYRPMDGGTAFFGQSHYTISDGYTLAQAKAYVEACIRMKVGGQVMIHPHNIGMVGKMSLADLTAFLDWLVGLYEAGTIDILTPSSLMFADINRSERFELLKTLGCDGTFATQTTGDANWKNWGTKTIETDGDGSKFVRIHGAETSLLSGTVSPYALQDRGLGGETFMFEALVRSNSASTVTARFLVQDYDSTARLNQTFTKYLATGNSPWTRMRASFTLHKDTDRLTIGFGINGGSGLDMKNLTIRKV